MSLCMNQSDLFCLYDIDFIFWSKDKADSNGSATQLREHGVNLEREDDVARFLGATSDWDPETGLLEMKQTGVII
jgi:hypothetical protein